MNSALAAFVQERSSISSTAHLVEAYNNSADNEESNEALRSWILAYIRFFVAQSENTLHDRWVRTYFELVAIEPKDENSIALVRSFQSTVIDRIFYGSKGGKRDMIAFARILNEIERKMKSDKWKTLSPIIQRIFTKAIASNSTRETFSSNMHIGRLLTWYKSFRILEKDEPAVLVGTLFADFRENILTKLENVSPKQRCEVVLLAAGVDIISKEIEPRSTIGHCTDELLLHLFEDVIDEYRAPIDMDALEQGCEHLKGILEKTDDWKPLWFEMLLALTAANLLSWKKADANEMFHEWYERVMELQPLMTDKDDTAAVQYTIIQQLLKAAFHAPDIEARRRNLETLRRVGILAKNSTFIEGDKTAIVTLDALTKAIRNPEHRQYAVEQLTKLKRHSTSLYYDSAFAKWLGPRELEAVIQENERMVGTLEPENLFDVIKQKISIGFQTPFYKDMTTRLGNAPNTEAGSDTRVMGHVTPIKSFDDLLSNAVRSYLGPKNCCTKQRVPDSFLQIEEYRAIAVAENELLNIPNVTNNLDGDYDSYLYEISIRDIDMTAGRLATYFNKERHAVMREAFSDILDAYVVLFERESFSFLDRDLMIEFSELGFIEPKTKRDVQLLRSLLNALQKRILENRFGAEDVIHGTLVILHNLDVTAFGDVADSFIELSKSTLNEYTLMSSFPPAIYKLHRVRYAATHLLIVMMSALGLGQMESVRERSQAVLAIFKKMHQDFGYLPFLCQGQLLVESLERQMKKKVSDDVIFEFTNARLSAKICHHYLVPGIGRGMKELDVFQAACNEFVGALDSGNKRWITKYDLLQGLAAAAMYTMETADGFPLFEKCYNHVLATSEKTKRNDARDVLRYAAIFELSAIARKARFTGIREEAAAMLVKFGRDKMIGKSWMKSESLLKTYYDALRLTRKSNIYAEPIVELLNEMERIDKIVIPSWLGNDTVEMKLEYDPRFNERSPSGSIFDLARSKVGMIENKNSIRHNLNELKREHQRTMIYEFQPLFLNDRPRDVKEMCFDLSYHQMVHSAEKGGVETREHLKYPTAEMTFQDLFSKMRFGGMKGSDMKTILIYGDHGSGKSSLSRRLPYEWSIGNWGAMFKRVYRLEMHELERGYYNDISIRSKRSITTAIANVNVARDRNEKIYKALVTEIEYEIEKPTTLVILDGLDEIDEVGKLMRRQLASCNCRLLLIGRNFGNEFDDEKVDLVVRSLGLNDSQLDEFIFSTFGGGTGRFFVKSSREFDEACKLARLPIIAKIIIQTCREYLGREHPTPFSLHTYSMIWKIMYTVWDRYVRKYKESHAHRHDYVEILETLASEAMSGRPVCVSEHYVKQWAQSTDMMLAFKDCGFMQRDDGLYRFTEPLYEKFFFGMFLCRHIGRDKKDEEIAPFIARHKYVTSFSKTMEFMTLGSTYDGYTGLYNIFAALDKNPKEIIGIQHVLMKLRLAEICLSNATSSISYMSSNKEYISNIVSRARRLFEIMMEGPSRYARHIAEKIVSVATTLPSVCSTYGSLLEPFPHQAKTTDSTNRTNRFGYDANYTDQSSQDNNGLKEQLTEGCLNEVLDVRQTTFETVKQYHATRSGFAATVMEMMEDKIVRDLRPDVRIGMAEMLDKIVRADKSYADDALKLLRRIIYEKHWMVRSAAIRSLGTIVWADPKHAKIVMTLVRGTYTDLELDVRLGSMETLTAIARHSAELADEVYPISVFGINDVSPEVRVQAVEALQLVSKSAPKRVNDVMAQAGRIVEDDAPEVRVATTRLVLAINAETDLTQLAKINFGFRALTDEAAQVREVGLEIVAQAIEYKLENVEKVMDCVYKFHEDKNASCRSAASIALRAVVGASPSAVNIAFSLLAKIDDELDWNVRFVTMETLHSIAKDHPLLSAQIYTHAKNLIKNADIEELPGVFKVIRTIVNNKAEYAMDAIETIDILLHGDKSAGNLSEGGGADENAQDPQTKGEQRQRNVHSSRGAKAREDVVKTLNVCVKSNSDLAPFALNLLSSLSVDGDWHVRKAAARSLIVLAECSTELEGDVIGMAESLSQDSYLPVRTEVIETLFALIDHSQVERPNALNVLGEIWKKNDPELREVIAKKFVSFCQSSRTTDEALLNFGQILLADLSSTHRSLTIDVLAVIAQATTSSSSLVFGMLKKLSADGDVRIRRTALETMFKTAAKHTEEFIEALEHCIKAAADIESKARVFMREAIHDAIAKTDGQARVILECAQKACEASAYRQTSAIVNDPITRTEVPDEKTYNDLHRAAQSFEQLESPLWKSINDCLDGILKQTADFVPAVFSVLERLSGDVDQHVRHIVMEILVIVIPVSPELIQSAHGLAAGGCQDTDPDVRRTGTKALATVLSIEPNCTGQVLAFLEDFIRDKDKHVRMSGLQVLRSILTSQKEITNKKAETLKEGEPVPPRPSIGHFFSIILPFVSVDTDKMRTLLRFMFLLAEDVESTILQEAVDLMDEVSERQMTASFSEEEIYDEAIALLTHKMIFQPIMLEKSTDTAEAWQFVAYGEEGRSLSGDLTEKHSTKVKTAVETRIEHLFPGIIKFLHEPDDTPRWFHGRSYI